jgi:choline kinase
MKAIILAAGKGTRLGEQGAKLPKGMLPFMGKPIIGWQLAVLRMAGVEDIVVVTGHCREAIDFPGVRYYHNSQYATTNMVESLMCARSEFNQDFIMAYADILYDINLCRLVINSPYDIAVAVDTNWRDYWNFRYGTTEKDLESLKVSSDGRIEELGSPVVGSAGVDYRYIGLIKFSVKGAAQAAELYDEKSVRQESWIASGKSFHQGYMTDLLNELIQATINIRPVVSRNGWLEFDTADDYKLACRLAGQGGLGRFLNLNTL